MTLAKVPIGPAAHAARLNDGIASVAEKLPTARAAENVQIVREASA